MATQNERDVTELVEMSSAEMIQIQGGVWFPTYRGIDGDVTTKGYEKVIE